MKEMYRSEYEDLVLAMELFSEGHEVDPLIMIPCFEKDAFGHLVRNLGRGVNVHAAYPVSKNLKSITVRFDGPDRYQLVCQTKGDLIGTFETSSSDVAYETMYNWLVKDILPEF